MAEPGWPALSLDGLEAAVFDTDGVLTDTASVHAAAWKRLFDEYLTLRTSRGREAYRPFEQADYLRFIDGRPRYDRGGQAAALGERGADVVVTDLGDLVLEGAVMGPGGP